VFKKPVFVTDYPKDIKAFYMRLNDDKQNRCGNGPSCARCRRDNRRKPEGRETDYLENRMKELGLKMEDYWWYLDLRRYEAPDMQASDWDLKGL